MTKDLKVRERQHNKGLNSEDRKDLYQKLRECGIKEIQLIPHSSFKNRVEAKRFECLQILKDHFRDKKLWQRVPNISDR